ncbi:ABC transporter permease subunit [Bacillaceae bacterium Marseille-Q3522]|nr:ABC transporter permease subunit [Bacillaceae bacterium Marseille-Q3522]
MRGFVALHYVSLPICLCLMTVSNPANIKSIFQDPSFVSACWNTVFISVTVAAIHLLTGNLAGYYLAQRKHWFWDILLQLPLLVPLLIVTAAVHYCLLFFNMSDQILGVIIVHLLPGSPYAIRISRNRFAELNRDLTGYIRLMGGGNWKMLMEVYLPLLQKSNEAIVLLSIVISISQYAVTAIIGGGMVPTLATLLFPFFTSSDLSLAATAVLLTVLLSMLIVWSFRLLYTGFVWIISRG